MSRDGYRLLEGFFDAATTSWLREAVTALGRGAERGLAGGESPLIVVPEADDPRLVCRYEHVMSAQRPLRERLLKALLPAVEELAWEPMLLFKDKVNNKYPGGGAYRPHQDIVAYKSFGPRYHVTAMLSIDAATPRNGCLWVAEDYQAVASRHPETVAERLGGRPVFAHGWGGPADNGDIRPDAASRFKWRPLLTQPADLVLFDSYVPHYSDRNCSAGPRRAMFLTFSPAKDGDWYERYYAEKRRNPLDPRFHVSTPTRF